MVDVMDAYRALNSSVLNVINDLVPLHVLETDDSKYQVRLEDTSISVSQIHERLDNTVVVGHRLEQYINRFYSIYLDSSEVVALDILINVSPENIDLTEFGEFL